MQIKHSALASHLEKKIYPLYILVGGDNYLIEASLTLIKKSIKARYEVQEKRIYLQSNEEWAALLDETKSYSLFAEAHLFNCIYDKKSLDTMSKKALTEYLNKADDQNFMILRAPSIPLKQWQWLNSQREAVIVLAYPLNKSAMLSWISNQFKSHKVEVSHEALELIYQATEGNMLACAQAIEKIILTHSKLTFLSELEAREHLSHQYEYSLFDLVEACLNKEAPRAIQILNQCAHNKTEPTLALWVLSQEIRILLQLHFLTTRLSLKDACAQLKIWPQKISLYQSYLKNNEPSYLKEQLIFCQTIDEYIKTGATKEVWQALEKLALALCLKVKIIQY